MHQQANIHSCVSQYPSTQKQMSVLHVIWGHNAVTPPAGDSLLATPMADPDSAVQPLCDTL